MCEPSNLRCSSYGLQLALHMLVTLVRIAVVIMISQSVRIIRSAVLIGIVSSIAIGCATTQSTSPRSGSLSNPDLRSNKHNSVGDRAVTVALQQLGAPYRYGGKTPSGFDCSGLVHYSYAHAGKNIPRTTAGQWANLLPIEDRNMRAGDLLFFSISGKMSHVGLYLGDGRFVHAPSSGKHVTIESLGSDYYSKAFVRAGRPR